MTASIRSRALLALLLLVPAPTIGALAVFYLAPGPVGHAINVAMKLWLVALPLVWTRLVLREPWSRSPLPAGRGRRSLAVGALWGVGIGVLFVAVYVLAGEHLFDPAEMRAALEASGFADPAVYALAALLLCTLNALVEELVWRWFVFRRCEELAGDRPAVALSALLFTIHHVVAFSVYFEPLMLALATLGVFVGGLVFSGLYRTYRSVWPAWVCHAIVDVAALLIGADILFR